MIECKYKYTDNTTRCFTITGGAQSLKVVDGIPKDADNGDKVVAGVFIYYSETDNGELSLTLLDGFVDDHVHFAQAKATADDTGQWASSGAAPGLAWGDLELKFTPPELGRDGATCEWVFNPWTPPVVLKVKIKRQTPSYASQPAIPCSAWSE